MSLLLHLDTLAAAVRRLPLVNNRVLQNLGSLHISAATITGVERWLLRIQTPLRYRQSYFNLFNQLMVINIDEPIAHRTAMIGHRLKTQGGRMATLDLFVAATAIVHNLTLVTADTQSFSQIPGLTLANWLIP